MEVDQPVELPSDIIVSQPFFCHCLSELWLQQEEKYYKSPLPLLLAGILLLTNSRTRDSNTCRQTFIRHSVQSLPRCKSINGLVCASHPSEPAFIFNPSTRESIKLPRAVTASRYFGTKHHLGFYPPSNEYKVLQVASYDDEDYMFNIFTLGTNSSWRHLRINLSDVLKNPLHCPFVRSVCLRGAIHWVYQKEKIIGVFDVGDEEFSKIPLPNHCIDSPDYFINPGIVDVGGCVAVYGYEPFEETVALVLWILEDYQNQVWVKETILIPNKYIDYGSHDCSLCMIHTGELAIVVQPPCTSTGYGYHDGPPALLLYDMKSKRFRIHGFIFPELSELSDEEDVYTWDERRAQFRLVASFDDSIVPLK